MSTNRNIPFIVTAAADGAPLPGLSLTFNYIRRFNADDTITDLSATFPDGSIVDRGGGAYEFEIAGTLLPEDTKIVYVIACGDTAAAPFLQGQEDANPVATVAETVVLQRANESGFFLKVGNTRPSIAAMLTIGAAPIGDLTGATVKFRMRDINGPAGVYKVDADATIVDPVTCAVRYDWVPEDVDTAGTFVADWHVIYADLSEQTVPNASSQFVFVSPSL